MMTIEEFTEKFEQPDTRILCETMQERREALLFLRDVCHYTVSYDRIAATRSEYLCPFLYGGDSEIHCTKPNAVFTYQYPYIAFSDLPSLVASDDICQRDMAEFLSTM